MAKIFISYRRDDSAAVTGRMFDRLQAHFGRSSVFMDVDSIPFGADFRKHLGDAVAQCDVLLAVIGPDWLKPQPDGRRRIDEPNDFVRIEIKAALDLGIRVVPVLLGQTMMPLEEHLPEALKEFAYRHAAQVDPGKDFHLYMDRVVKKLDQLLAQPRTPPTTGTPDPAAAPRPAVAAVPAPSPMPAPALDALVKSVQVIKAWNGADTRGQVFAKLKIALKTVDAAFAYLESLLARPDEDLANKAATILVKHCPNPGGAVVQKALELMQTSENPGVRQGMTRDLAALMKMNQTTWDAGIQDEIMDALKFVADYDVHHPNRLTAIDAIGSLGRPDGTNFLVSLIRGKKGSIEKTSPDWSQAVSSLSQSGDIGAGRALAQFCSDPGTDRDVLESIIHWVKCGLWHFERFPIDIKTAIGEGAKTVLRKPAAEFHSQYAEAALTVVVCYAPKEAAASIVGFLESDDVPSRSAVSRALGGAEGNEHKKRFLRLLKQNPDAARIVTNALQRTAADPDTDQFLKQSAEKAITMLQTA